MSSGGHIDPSNKKIALQIAILAVVLAFSETLGKGAQTAALSYNIEASNLWSFFQAKTLRQTTMRTAAEGLEAQFGAQSNDRATDAVRKQIDTWKKTAERYQSEPETNEGRKELAARAKKAEEKRDRSLAAYHHYEVASAAVQIGIVLASAEVITGVIALGWASAALGVAAVGFCLVGYFWPMAVHLF